MRDFSYISINEQIWNHAQKNVLIGNKTAKRFCAKSFSLPFSSAGEFKVLRCVIRIFGWWFCQKIPIKSEFSTFKESTICNQSDSSYFMLLRVLTAITITAQMASGIYCQWCSVMWKSAKTGKNEPLIRVKYHIQHKISQVKLYILCSTDGRVNFRNSTDSIVCEFGK